MKSIYIIFTLVLGTCFSAQATIWQKTFGGTLEDRFVKSIKTTDNNLVFIGHAKSNDGDITINYGGFDVFINKMDTNGNYIWKKTLGGSEDDLALNVINTNDGGFILLSKSKSSNLTFMHNNGNFDLWMTKIDINGNIVWNKSLGGSGEEISADIINFNDDFIVSINTNSNDFDFANSNAISKDVWLVKMSSLGNVIWKKQLQGSKDEDLVKITNSDNTTFLTLINTKSTDFDFINNTATDASKGFLFQMDTNGNLVMDFMIESDNVQYNNFIYNVKETTDSFVLCGKEDYKFQDGATLIENFDANFLRIAKTGNLTWKKHYNYGTANADEAQFVDTTLDNQLIFFGRTGGTITVSIWRAKFDMMGNQINLGNIDGSYKILSVFKSTNGSFIENVSFNRLYMSIQGPISDILLLVNPLGTSSTTVPLKTNLATDAKYSYSHLYNDNTLISFWDELKPTIAGTTDGNNVWITKNDLNSYLSTSTAASSEIELKIYPNPTSDRVYFSKNADQISLFDASGRLVRKTENSKDLDLSFLQNGAYFLKLMFDGNVKTFKVMKK